MGRVLPARACLCCGIALMAAGCATPPAVKRDSLDATAWRGSALTVVGRQQVVDAAAGAAPQTVTLIDVNQRAEVVARYAEKRAQLKKQLIDPNSTDEQREAARIGLQKLPRNASPVRLRSRDVIDGRPRGVLTKFGISRVRFRDMAHRGELPGVTKSSW